jgi:hypothetical protein
MQKKMRSKLFFANKGSKTARIRQIRQTKINPYKIGQIRQKSARNWESARNIFCPPDDFQIRQNFANLAEKTAIRKRCKAVLNMPLSEVEKNQRCQIKKFKSARSDVKIRQNPPFSIGQICQKPARNLELFVPFFTPWGSVLCFFYCGFGLISGVDEVKYFFLFLSFFCVRLRNYLKKKCIKEFDKKTDFR